MKRIFLILLSGLTFTSLNSAIIDTTELHSESMKKNIKTIIIRPDNYTPEMELPVVYLLHGYSGNHLDWIKNAKGFEQAADQDIFGAAGSMSGGVDIRPFPENWDMAKQLGTYAEQPERWEKNTVINMLNLLTQDSLAIIIDCGTNDFFFKVNENLHQQLLYRNIPHDYITRPGAHNWPYWTKAVKYQFLFMNDYFKSAKI